MTIPRIARFLISACMMATGWLTIPASAEDIYLAIPSGQQTADSVAQDLQKVVVLAWRFGQPARAGNAKRVAAANAAPADSDGSVTITFGDGQRGRIPAIQRACATRGEIARVMFSPPDSPAAPYELTGVTVSCPNSASRSNTEEVTFTYKKIRKMPGRTRMKGDFSRGDAPDKR